MAKKRTSQAAKQGLEEAIRKNPKIGLFVAGLAKHDGDARTAAEEVGWKPNYGATLLKRYPEIRTWVAKAYDDAVNSVKDLWAESHRVAVRRVLETLNHVPSDLPRGKLEPREKIMVARLELESMRLRLEAARFAVERLEGRPRQAVDLNLLRHEEDELESVRYRFALALAQTHAWALPAALQYADEHPEEVQEWWESVEERYGNASEA